MMKTLKAFIITLVVFAPAIAFADATASIGALYPGNTVGMGVRTSFSMITTGFNNPRYYVTDSFAGGVTTLNIDTAGNFVWSPNKDHLGSHTITVAVSDSDGHSASATVTIDVVAPSVSVGTPSPASTVRYGVPVSFAITASGFTTPTYAVSDGYQGSSVTLYHTRADGTFSWTPTFQDVGVHKLLVTVKDYQNTATASQTITVIGAPNLTIEKLTPGSKAAVGESVSFDVVATGMLSPIYGIKDSFVSGTTSNLTIDTAGHVTWTPTAADIGIHMLTATSTNTAQDSASAQTTITVVPAGTSLPKAATPSVAPGAPTVPAATTRFTFTKDLSIGSRGLEVTALQQRLVSLGFLKSEPTGYFGAMTKSAVQAYQKSVGLPTVGRVGPGTRASLNK